MTEPRVLDCTGMKCPRPVIELARLVRDLPAGATVLLLADDPAAAVDVPAWCRMRGHDFLGAEEISGETAYRVHTSTAMR